MSAADVPPRALSALQDLVARFAVEPPPADEEELARALKNAAIGSATNKLCLLNLGLLEHVQARMSASECPQAVLVHLLAIAASLVRADAPMCPAVRSPSVAGAALRLLHHSSPAVVKAAARALSPLLPRIAAPLDLLFTEEHVVRLVRLLRDGPSDMLDAVASVVAAACAAPAVQDLLRIAGAFTELVRMASSSNMQTLEAGLRGLAALTRRNSRLCRMLSDHALSRSFARLAEHKRPSMRLYACMCLSNLARAGLLGPADMAKCYGVIKLLSEEGSVREQAPLVLGELVEGDEELQRMACEAGALDKLVEMASNEATPVGLLANALHALSLLCGESEDCRRQAVSLKLIPVLRRVLTHSAASVRATACHCVQNISRSVRILRSYLLDPPLTESLVDLLADNDTTVQVFSASALCNLVLDYAPLKSYLLKSNCIDTFIAFLDAPQPELRLRGIWCIQNLLYVADLAIKQEIMHRLSFERLFSLVASEDPALRVHALIALRNIVCSKEEKNEVDVFGHTVAERILALVGRLLLRNTPASEMIQAMYIVCNIASGTAAHKAMIMETTVPSLLCGAMQHPDADVRASAVWTVINLTWRDDDTSAMSCLHRLETLRSAGIVERLQAMKTDPSLDVRDRVRTALEHFHHPPPHLS